MENDLRPSNAGQGLGIAALVLGILAVIAAFIPCFGFVAVLFGTLAIIFGAVGLSQAKKENAPRTMPKAGLILGIVGTGFVIIWMLLVVGTIGSVAKAAVDSANEKMEKRNDSIKKAQEKETDTIVTQ